MTESPTFLSQPVAESSPIPQIDARSVSLEDLEWGEPVSLQLKAEGDAYATQDGVVFAYKRRRIAAVTELDHLFVTKKVNWYVLFSGSAPYIPHTGQEGEDPATFMVTIRDNRRVFYIADKYRVFIDSISRTEGAWQTDISIQSTNQRPPSLAAIPGDIDFARFIKDGDMRFSSP